ncbi:MAG: hypothetical protein LBF88_02535 [Planctomycetaceae bacterium]|nr:hypothetical protein [Planctomycetaceae bacterium]
MLCEPPGSRLRDFVAAVDSGKNIFAEKLVAVDSPGIRRFLAANAKAKEKRNLDES